MKCLVTGGAGFVGSHLCEHLLSLGHEVICMDNFITGNKHNISEFKENFTLVEHDICEPFDIKCDWIFNLACPASPVKYMQNAIETVKASTIGMINVLDNATKHKARILQASTSEVYGNPLVHPQTEDYWGNVNPIGIRSCYDEGKRVAECLCMDYHRMKGTDLRIVRIFNTYGPKMHPTDGRVISNFMMQALQNEPIHIYGDGKQTRSFMYVTDLIEGLMVVMNSNIKTPVNIGNPEEITIKNLAHKVRAVVKSDSEILHKNGQSDEPLQRKPHIEQIGRLGWKPKVMLEEGLTKSLGYFLYQQKCI